MYENYGINFSNHPLLKPVRYPLIALIQKAKLKIIPFIQLKVMKPARSWSGTNPRRSN
jgi:hypothetical protein